MILLRLLSWPYVRQHVLRTALTAAGIALGVAVFLGMHAANTAVLSGFADTVDRIAGKTQLQVTAGEAGFGEEMLEAVQSASAVRVAVPIIEVVVDSNIRGEGSLLILGVDMTGDRSLRDYDVHGDDDTGIDDPLVFLAQPDSLMLSKAFADRRGLVVGSRLPLGTVNGERTFTVRGIVESSGLASAFGGNIAIMDIYAAQYMFGRGRTFDRIDVGLQEGATLEEGEREISALVGPGFDVQPPAARGRQFESMLASYALMASVSSSFALLIGIFIIYNAFAIAVSERRTEVGILRALGATRHQIRWLFLGEGALVGAVGSAAGLVAGLLIAQAVAVGLGMVIGNVYRMGQVVEGVAVSPGLLVVSFAAGVVTSVIAAFLPARNAAAVDPVVALQKGRRQVLSGVESRVRLIGAAVLALLAGACLAVPAFRPAFYVGYLAAMLAALLLTPFLVLGLAHVWRPVLVWLRPVEGAFAADSLLQSPRRTSASVAALMFSLALAVAFAGMGAAHYRSMVGWMDSVLNPDLFIMPTESMDVRAARFPIEVGDEIASVPGVDRVHVARNGRTIYRGTPVMVVAVEMGKEAETTNFSADAGEVDPRAVAGEGLLVSDNFAQRQGLRLGDRLQVAAPYGLIDLPIVGIELDHSDPQGAILMDWSLYVRYWRDDSVNVFRVYTTPGVNVMDVRTRILERFDGHRRVFVFTNGELKAYILQLLQQWSQLTMVQVAVAVLVAVLGIVNTLTVSISDRRREIGVLRAVGAGFWQIRQVVWIEAVSVGLFGLVLGVALGAINLFYVLEVVRRDITGISLDYEFPLTTVAVLIPVIAGAALIAALWPAESAVRGRLVEALEYE
jgi:putative ABC transport system permease protein